MSQLLLVPGYKFYNVGNLQNDPVIDVHHGLILHETGTNVSPLEFFDGPSNGIESTLYLPKKADQEKQQYRTLNREADANFKANSWIGDDGLRHGFTSLETQGKGDEPWTDYQLNEIKELCLLLSKALDFPLKVPLAYHGRGVGYHTQFPQWTNVPSKVCPGAGKIEQYHKILVPWMKEQTTKYYITKRGDTVPSIATRFNVPQWQLWRWNPDANPPFPPGTKLRVKA
jgi:hypothetical protein